MKKVCATTIVLALLWTAGCSVLISTPPVARIQIHGSNNQLSEYIVVLEAEPSSSSFDIPITDNYALNLDFQWLFGEEFDLSTADDQNQSMQEPIVSPWMMCTYRF